MVPDVAPYESCRPVSLVRSCRDARSSADICEAPRETQPSVASARRASPEWDSIPSYVRVWAVTQRRDSECPRLLLVVEMPQLVELADGENVHHLLPLGTAQVNVVVVGAKEATQVHVDEIPQHIRSCETRDGSSHATNGTSRTQRQGSWQHMK